MKPIYIFDLDGTLADGEHRLHHIQGDRKDWPAYFKACVYDKPIWPVIEVLKALRKAGAETWIWTGRSDEVQAETEQWLYSHGCLQTTMLLHWQPFNPPEQFLMRRAGDHRNDDDLKRDWLSQVEPPEWKRLQIGGVFEDRDRVVAMWREAGLRCFQVAPGAF